MRVALLGIVHESNTFSQSETGLEQFRNGHWHFGEDIITEYKEAFHEVGGMIAAMESKGIELIPVMYAEATPGGIVRTDAFEHLMATMFDELKKKLPVDGCLVVPHGAGVCEGYRDMDGHWLTQLRAMLGPDMPIIGTIDPHANVSEAMINATNALVAYKTNPHVDQREVGWEAGMIMADTLMGKIKPVQLFASLPLAISIEQQLTDKDPCRALLNKALTMTLRENIVSISIVLGFPYADVQEMGSSVIVIADANYKAGDAVRTELVEHIVSSKHIYNGEKKDIIKLTSEFSDLPKPLLLLDMGDNVGGGAPGDSTYILDHLDMAGLKHIFCCLYDPEAVVIASSYDAGQKFELTMGNRPDQEIRRKEICELVWKGAGQFDEHTPRHGGQVHFDMGQIAIIRSTNEHIIMLTSLRIPPYSLCQLTHFGIDPAAFHSIIAKGVNAPIAAYSDVCPSIVQVNSPGITSADMTLFNYQHRRKPLFPFEDE